MRMDDGLLSKSSFTGQQGNLYDKNIVTIYFHDYIMYSLDIQSIFYYSKFNYIYHKYLEWAFLVRFFYEGEHNYGG